MSHHKLREDKTCLNCGRTVDDRYCTHCGQENIETHQTFIGLLTHFVEDFTHYEGSFWKTIKYLFTRPGYISEKFLEGKRGSYLPPVRLYIFVSFVAFLLPHLLPEHIKKEVTYTPQQQAYIDSVMNDSNDHIEFETGIGLFFSSEYKTMEQLDSTKHAREGTANEMTYADYVFAKKTVELRKYSPQMLMSEFEDSLARSFPKALFVYMPLFAFVLWLFHGKRRWLYFDHAIFTLHYFSFILLTVALMSVVINVGDWMQVRGVIREEDNDWFTVISLLVAMSVWLLYFFIAHYKLYKEHFLISMAKGMVVMFINTIFFSITIILTLFMALMTLH